MVTLTSSGSLLSYAGAVASAGCEAALTGAWVMAGELPVAKRRLVRAGMTAAAGAIAIGVSGLLHSPAASEPGEPAMTSGEPGQDGPEQDGPERSGRELPPQLRPAVMTAAGGAAVAVMLGSSLLQKRWLQSLARGGHVHPHRSLALRTAAISFAGTLPARLLEVREHTGPPAALERTR